MNIKYVSFGHHVCSQEFLRTGDRYLGLGTIKSMVFDKGVLSVVVVKDNGAGERKLHIPAANIAVMEE